MTIGEGLQPGCMMKILEAERSSNSSKKKATQVHPIWGLGRWKGTMNARSVKAWLLPGGSTPF
jgi:hypothetical protein